MAPTFLGTSTTVPATSSAYVQPLDSGAESTSSATYIIGLILFSAIFTCGFVLVWCQIKSVSKAGKCHSAQAQAGKDAACLASPDPAQPSTASPSSNIVELLKVTSGDMEEIVVGRASHSPWRILSPAELSSCRAARVSAAVSPVEIPSWHRAASCPARFGVEPVLGHTQSSASIGAAVEQAKLRSTASWNGDSLRLQEPYSQDSAAFNLGGWVGSAEWAAARASRKNRLQGSIFASPPSKKLRKVPPAAPATAPPTLEVLQVDLEGAESVARANAGVREELQTTSADSVALRRKTFKGLCARWHPDKNSSGDAELSKEVFQYLQSQKEWYLPHVLE